MLETDTEWSTSEKKVAQTAFDKAYEREITALLQEVRESSSTIAELNDLWKLHDFLSARRHDIDGKYDYSYSVLIFTFSRLVKEGWLQLGDLEGLDRGKLAKIASLASM
jgi:hypothetical protein